MPEPASSPTLRSFLWRGFDQVFCTALPEWIDLAERLYEGVREDVVGDAAAYSADWRAEADFDVAFFRAMETDAGFQATLLYRISHALFVEDANHPALRYFAFLMRVRTSMEIYYSAEIAPGLRIVHGAGTVIGPRHKIGPGFTVYQNVTLGQRRRGAGEFITIGENSMVCAGAKVLGMIRIGDHVTVAANAVLLTDADSGSTFAGVPAVRVR